MSCLLFSPPNPPSPQLVAGSVVMAFETVCPERTDLIHKNYRKLCNLLVDVDEWGQVMILSMLTRYARSQFVDPNKEVSCLYMYVYIQAQHIMIGVHVHVLHVLKINSAYWSQLLLSPLLYCRYCCINCTCCTDMYS